MKQLIFFFFLLITVTGYGQTTMSSPSHPADMSPFGISKIVEFKTQHIEIPNTGSRWIQYTFTTDTSYKIRVVDSPKDGKIHRNMWIVHPSLGAITIQNLLPWFEDFLTEYLPEADTVISK